VEEAIALFSGEKIDNPREIWLVDPAPKVIDSFQSATQKLGEFMQSQGLANAPEDVANLKGDAARSQFVNLFKEVQRLKTQLDQYTDLNEEQKTQITQIAPPEQLQGFKGVYLETAKRLKEQQDKQGDQAAPEVQQLDFEFVLFASAVIDYDYIMGLIARMTQQKPGKLTLNREQLIGLIQSDAKFIDEREDIAEYIRGLPVGEALDEAAIRAGYSLFEPQQMLDENKAYFRKILHGFLNRYPFNSELFPQAAEEAGTP
jgi:type I restriction enzyme, R subunit